MNIAFIISSLNMGGAEKQTVVEANLLCRKHQVFLFYFRKGPLFELLSPNLNVIQFNNKMHVLRVFELAYLLKSNKIVTIHASLYASMIISALAAVFVPIKVFWHFHSHEYDVPILHRLLYRFLGRSSLVKKLIFVNKELMLHMCKRFHLPVLKSMVLYNTSTFKYTLPYMEKITNPVVTIGFVGRLVELKRVNLLVDLARYFESKNFFDYKMLIVGDGPERPIIQQLVEDARLDGKFSFTGFQNQTESFYDQMDIFVLPSREECLSIATIDAGIKGLPSVVFNVGGNNEIVKDGHTGFVVNNSEEFFKEVWQLAVNIQLRETLGKNAREYCNQKFGNHRHGVELRNLYNEVGYSLRIDF